MMIAYHRDAVAKLLPYATRFDHLCQGMSYFAVRVTAAFLYRGRILLSQQLSISGLQSSASMFKVAQEGKWNQDQCLRAHRAYVERLKRPCGYCDFETFFSSPGYIGWGRAERREESPSMRLPDAPACPARGRNRTYFIEFTPIDFCLGGWQDEYRGWYDIRGIGACFDYCTWRGPNRPGGDPRDTMDVGDGRHYWSCMIGDSGWTKRGAFKSWTWQKCARHGTPMING